MNNDHQVTTLAMETDALRLLQRVVADAYDNWPGGDAEEQATLLLMKNQLYAALMDHLFEMGSI